MRKFTPDNRAMGTANYHIRQIILDDKFKHFTIRLPSGETGQALPNLSKINIFVGPNNSGKSRFMRHLAAIEKIAFDPKITVNGEDEHFSKLHDAKTWQDQQIAARIRNQRSSKLNQIVRTLPKK